MQPRQEVKLPRLKTCVFALSVCLCVFLAFNSALIVYTSSSNSYTNTVAGDCPYNAPGTAGEVATGVSNKAHVGENAWKCPTGNEDEHRTRLAPGFSPNNYNTFRAGWSHKVGSRRFRECAEFDHGEPCFDFGRCSLSHPFLVYTYNIHLQGDVSTKDSHLLENLGLQHKYSLTSDPNKACIFLIITGPLMNKMTTNEVETKLHSLPYWNEGKNHLLFDISNTDVIHIVNTGNAIVVSALSLKHSERSEFNILTPPLFQNSEKYLGGIFTAQRPTLLYFEGCCVEDEAVLDLNDLYCALQNAGLHNVVMKTHSGHSCLCNVVVDGAECSERTLHGEQNIRLELCSNSTFTLILGENGDPRGFTTSTRLVEALKSGSVPIVVGVSVLPFGDVIEWQRAAVILPYGELLNIFNVITETRFDAIVEYRKQGRFLFDTYFKSPEKIMQSVFAIVRYRALHPPSLVPDRHPPSVSLREKPPNSTQQLHKSSVWFPYSSDFWNKPPGPFHHFPSTPFRPTPVHYSGTKKAIRRDTMIQHVLCLRRLNQSVNWKLTSKDIVCLELLRTTPFLRERELDLLNQFRILHQDFDATFLRSGHNATFSTRWQQLVHRLYRKFTEDVSIGITGSDFSSNLYGNYADENFTILMHTTEYHRDFVASLSGFKDLPFLEKVVVLCTHTGGAHGDEEVGVPVDVVRIEDSPSSQFLPLNKIQTEAVLYISSHVNISQDDIQFAFRVWRENRDGIVGWGGGYHAAWSDPDHRWLVAMGNSCEVSMVNNGAAFLHKYYLYLYSYWMPQEAKDLVDKHPSCSDMAMSFLVSHISRKPPLKLQSETQEPQTAQQHTDSPDELEACLNQLVGIYGYMPLMYTQFRANSVLFGNSSASNSKKCFDAV